MELGMKKETVGPNRWTKPEIRRLGEIKDVAGAQTPVAQAGNTKS
jgi:hypothetical protein